MSRAWFEAQTIGSLPERAAQRWGGREALCWEGRRRTFAEVSEGVNRVAWGLMALGVQPGETVALWMLNRPEWIEAMFAVMKIGAVLVPINTRFRTDDVAYVLGHAEASTLLLAARSGPIDYLGMAREAAGRLPRLTRIVALGQDMPGDAVAWDHLVASGARVGETALNARAAAVDPEALAFMPYTSGTTGFPKGVMHDHGVMRRRQ